MPNLNRVILAGNLTRDPEVRYTQGGLAVAKFGLAINRKFTQNGETKESTCFVDLTAFGRSAEVLEQYIGKGDPLLVEGRLEFSQWESKDGGGKRSKLEVIVEQFQFLRSGDASDRRDSGGGRRAQKQSVPERDGAPDDAVGGGGDFGGIPFDAVRWPE